MRLRRFHILPRSSVFPGARSAAALGRGEAVLGRVSAARVSCAVGRIQTVLIRWAGIAGVAGDHWAVVAGALGAVGRLQSDVVAWAGVAVVVGGAAELQWALG